MLIGLITATLLARPLIAAQSDRQCQTAIANALAHEKAVAVPATCWRMGPVTLGMNEIDVEHHIGSPVAIANVAPHAPYRAALYAFPARFVRHGSIAVRLVELRYEQGRLVAIDTSPGARIDSTPCGGRPASTTGYSVDIEADAGPLLHFAGVKVGDPTATLRDKFGRMPGANTSRDWLNYLPVPISFEVDPDRHRITGIAIATDDAALTSSALPKVLLKRDRATCRLVSVGYYLGGS